MGKVHYIGVSNVTGWQFQKIIDTSHYLGLNQIISNQVISRILLNILSYNPEL